MTTKTTTTTGRIAPLAIIAIALAATVSAPLLAQTGTAAATVGATDVVKQLEAAGYRDIRGLELDDGLWEADAITPRGFEVELKINPTTGAILNPETATGTTATDVLAALQQRGYSDIRTLELDDGALETEARNAQGQWVELRLDANTGAVINVEVDD